MRIQPVAYRYARSLMELAIEKGQLEEVRADLGLVADICDGSEELRAILRSPVLRPDHKQRVLHKVFAGRIGQIADTFITVLVRKGRETLLHAITLAFAELYRVHKGIIKCQVTTAVRLTPLEVEKIDRLVQARFPGKTIEREEIIDPEIIGGGIIQVGDLQWDASVRSKLHAIKRTFAENPYLPKL